MPKRGLTDSQWLDQEGREGFRDMDRSIAGSKVAEIIPKCNYLATTAPTVTDDKSKGYAVGSRWIDLTADKEYVCADPTIGVAVWIQTAATGSTMPHAIRSSTHSDTTAGAGTKGDFLAFGTTWTSFPIGANGCVLVPASGETLGVKYATGLNITDTTGEWQLRAISAGNQAATLELMPRAPAGGFTGDVLLFRVYGTDFLQDATNYARMTMRINRAASIHNLYWEFESNGTQNAGGVAHTIDGNAIFTYQFNQRPQWALYNSDMESGRSLSMAPATAETLPRAYNYIPWWTEAASPGLQAEGAAGSVANKRPPSGGVMFYNHWYSASSKWQKWPIWVRGVADPGATPDSELVIGEQYQGEADLVALVRLSQNGRLYLVNFVSTAEIAEPATPAAGTGLWYFDSADSKPKAKSDAGTVYVMSNASTEAPHPPVTVVDGAHTCGADQVLAAVAATAAQIGHATAAQITKLDGIEALADVTDATNVEAAGAVMVSDADWIDLTDAGETALHSHAGGGGGDVATDAIWDAKGDLAVGTGANTAARLAVGADDTIPMAAAAEVTGIKWVASAAGASIAGVQAAGVGTADTFARSDHAHGIAHSIADNALVTVDQADAADNDYAKFTANGLEGRSYAEARTDLAIGYDIALAVPGRLYQGDNVSFRIPVPHNGSMTKIVWAAQVAGGSNLVIDINCAGTNTWTENLTLTAGTSGTTNLGATQTVTQGDTLTLDINSGQSGWQFLLIKLVGTLT